MIDRFALGLALSAAVAIAARALRLLTRSGVVASVAVGTVVFGFGGWGRAGLLVLFFVSSSLLTRWQGGRKIHPEHAAGRTGAQVLANGAVATLLALWGEQGPGSWGVVAYAGAIAAATADTWASEIGMLAAARPRLITTWRVVPRGQSGGVTWWGTIGGMAGATVVAAAAAVWLRTPTGPVWVAGSAAMLVDSALGAALEGRWRRMTNETVNLLATTTGAVLAAAMSRL